MPSLLDCVGSGRRLRVQLVGGVLLTQPFVEPAGNTPGRPRRNRRSHCIWRYRCSAGACARVTVKSPACPFERSHLAVGQDLDIRWRPVSTSFGEIVHMAQSLVGKVLSSWAMCPPMADSFSTR